MPDCLATGFWPHTIDGLTLGSIYALIALGYTMVYGVLQLINFAHSEIFMIGTFAALYALMGMGADASATGPVLALYVVVAVAAAMAASAIVAVGVERVAYRPLRRRGAPRLAFLISAIGASLFLSNLFLVWTDVGGPSPRPYPDVLARTNVFSIFDYGVSNKQIMVVAVMVAMFFVLDRFVMQTRTGTGIRAVAQDPDTASLMGIDINKMITLTFVIGGLMAGAGGAMYGLFFGQARFNIGFVPGIKAFTAAVLGGIGNIRGAVLGGVLLGLTENLGVTCLPTEWKDVIAFMVLVLVLMFRPAGILGEGGRT